MKRKNIIGLSVISGKNDETIGTVQEIIINKNEFKIDFFIVAETLDNSFALPFNKAELNDNAVIAEAVDLMKIDSMMFYNEVKKGEVIFFHKDVLNDKNKVIGKVTDYSFDRKTGVLDYIVYYDFDFDKINNIKNSMILSNTNSTIIIKGEQKPIIKEDKISNVDEAINYFKNIEEEAKKNVENSKEDKETKEIKNILENINLDDYRKDIDFLIDDFKNKLNDEKEKLKSLYLFLEKEVIEEFETTISYIHKKRDEWFTEGIEEKEQLYLKDLEILHDKAMKEIDKINEKIVNSKSMDYTTNDDKVFITEGSIADNIKREVEKVIGHDKSQDDNFSSESFKTPTEFIDSEDELIESLGYNPEKYKEPEPDTSNTFFESNKDLEKLYELQRKRMSILKKL